MGCRRCWSTAGISRFLHSRLRASASFSDAKFLYREQAKVLHPDTASGSNDDFRALQEAWECYEAEAVADERSSSPRTTTTAEMVLFKLRAGTSWDAHQLHSMRTAVTASILHCGSLRFGGGFEEATVRHLDTATARGVLAVHVQT